VGYLALEADHTRFQIALADGYHVHQANSADPRSWDAIGMGRRELVVVAAGNATISRELAPLVEERLPGVIRIVATTDEITKEDFATFGVATVDTSTPSGTEQLVELVFGALGRERRLPVRGLADDEVLSVAA
jgi:CPA2 family monovalent cation:H+ antiporter-2